MSIFNSGKRGGRKVSGSFDKYIEAADINAILESADSDTAIEWQQPNPKAVGSNAYSRYQQFMSTTTCGEYIAIQKDIDGDVMGDLKDALKRGFVKIG